MTSAPGGLTSGREKVREQEGTEAEARTQRGRAYGTKGPTGQKGLRDKGAHGTRADEARADETRVNETRG